MSNNTIEFRKRLAGMRQAFDDEASADDYVVCAVENYSLHIEFHSDDIDETPFISLGYDQVLNLIQFLGKASKQLERSPRDDIHEAENILNTLNKMFDNL